jgi:hypothetical protein
MVSATHKLREHIPEEKRHGHNEEWALTFFTTQGPELARISYSKYCLLSPLLPVCFPFLGENANSADGATGDTHSKKGRALNLQGSCEADAYPSKHSHSPLGPILANPEGVTTATVVYTSSTIPPSS